MVGDVHFNTTNSKGCNKEHAFFNETAESSFEDEHEN